MIYKADGAALHSAGHQGAVGVFDQGIEQFPSSGGVFRKPLFPAEHGTILPGARFRVGGDRTGEGVAEEVRSDEDADVVAFEALAGVDAPDLDNALGL